MYVVSLPVDLQDELQACGCTEVQVDADAILVTVHRGVPRWRMARKIRRLQARLAEA